MNKPLPEIVCPKCHLKQPWRRQEKCIHNGCVLSNWDVAVQLKEPYGAGNKAIPLPNCEECKEQIQELPVLDTEFYHITCWLRKRIGILKSA